MQNDISIKRMFESGVHFGHRKRFWHPKMKPYIYSTINDVLIINLEITIIKLKLGTRMVFPPSKFNVISTHHT